MHAFLEMIRDLITNCNARPQNVHSTREGRKGSGQNSARSAGAHGHAKKRAQTASLGRAGRLKDTAVYQFLVSDH